MEGSNLSVDSLPNQSDCQSLIDAILLDQPTKYNSLLDENSHLVHNVDSFGDTALLIAIQKQKLSLAQKMIALGADVNHANNVSILFRINFFLTIRQVVRPFIKPAFRVAILGL